MNSVSRANLFGLILVMLQIFGQYSLALLHLPISVTIVLGELLFLIVPVFIYFVLTKQSVKKVLRLNPINIKTVLIAMAISVAAYPVAAFFGYITSFFFTNNVTKVLTKIQSLPLYILVGVVALTPALCEEIAVRGVILSGYKRVSPLKAAIMTGLIFGILHMNPEQLLYAWCLGALFAYMIYITDSIFTTMVCHFTFNSIQAILSWLILKLPQASGTKTASIKTMPLELRLGGLAIYFVLALIFLGVIIVLLQELKKANKHKNFTDDENSKVSFTADRALNWPIITMFVIYIGYICLNFAHFKI